MPLLYLPVRNPEARGDQMVLTCQHSQEVKRAAIDYAEHEIMQGEVKSGTYLP